LTKEARLDQQIEESIQRWKSRIGDDFGKHNVGPKLFEPIKSTEGIAVGTWLYSSNGAVLAYVAEKGIMWHKAAKTWDVLHVLVGLKKIDPCECDTCLTYRTCFMAEAA
jgi:hypothetical protein